MLRDVLHQLRCSGAQFTPGDLTVAIGIDADRELHVTHRQFDRTAQLLAVHLHDQKAVAGDMRLGQRADQQQQERERCRESHRSSWR